MRNLALDSPLALCLLVAFFGALSSLMPMSPAEPVLVGVAAVAPPWLLFPLLLVATVSHMSTKTLVFLGGARLERLVGKRHRQRFDATRARLAGRSDLQRSTLLLSSITGLPPFYITTALCGTLRMPLCHFLMIATSGRAIRFAALIFIPQLFRAAELPAQHVRRTASQPVAVVVAGDGTETIVLISGVLGGVARFRPLAALLVADGQRVITIDPYLLSIDSADVSLAALARRVGAELAARGVVSARVVGHGHGGGVALRLAASADGRVSELYLLDVGAQATQRTPVFSSSLRLVPFLTRLPYGRTFVRNRFIAGLRENSGTSTWLDARAEADYADAVLDDIDRVIKLANRLAVASEPEALSAVVARVTVPVTVILGAVKRPASPGAEEIAALDSIRDHVRTQIIAGVSHFPHEEAPSQVFSYLRRKTQVARRKEPVS